MCCDLPEAVLVPPAVAEMLAEYRRLQSTSIIDWGREVPDVPGARYRRFLDLGRLWAATAETGHWSEAVRRCLPDPPPRGLIVAKVTGSGVELIAGPLPLVIPKRVAVHR